MIWIIVGILWLPSWVPWKHYRKWDLTIFHKREHGIHKRKGHWNQILRLRLQYAAIHTDPSQILKRESAIYFFFSAHSFEETIKGYSFDFLSSFEWFIEANSSSHSVLCICFPIVKTRLSDGSAFITYVSYVEFLYYSPSSKNRIYLSSWLQVWFIFKISSNINRTKLLLSLNTSSI